MIDVNAPLLPEAVESMYKIFDMLPDLPEGSYFDRVYNHWTVAGYQTCFGEYNGEVLLIDRWILKITHDPLDNARGGEGEASHTYLRNSHAFGIATAGMMRATPHDFGPTPANHHEFEFLCAFNAAVCKKYNLDCEAAAPSKFHPNANEHVIMTHAEAALTTPSGEYEHYYCYKEGADPDCRWDWATTDPQKENPDETEARATGDLIRARSHKYKAAWGNHL